MNCENCGGQIRRGDSYCPSCGMELLISEYKPLQKKYMRGEYRDDEEFLVRDDDGFYPTENASNDQQNHDDSGYGYRGQNRYLTQEYGHEYDYIEESERSSGWLLVVLFLVIALMLGFVIGMIVYTNNKLITF